MRGEPPWRTAFTDMRRRRVRWGNVGGLAALACAAALIATHEPAAPRPPAPTPPPREAHELPRLRDIPRLVLPRPRERRASKRNPRLGRPSVIRDMRGKVTEHPRNPRPSPQTSPAGQPAAPEWSAPAPRPPAGPAGPPLPAEFT